jgi:TolA-binding protein
MKQLAQLLVACLFFTVSALASDVDAQKDFDRALKLSQAGMETQALQSWVDFLRRHPSNSLADEAYYHLGEVYFRRGQFAEARIELERVFRFPASTKAGEAAVLVGETFMQQKKEKEARIYWQSVLRRYPKSAASERAKNLLLALGVEHP